MGGQVVACRFEGCDRPSNALGLCRSHYMQAWRGAELTPLRPKREQAPKGLTLEDLVFWHLRQGIFSRGCILLFRAGGAEATYPKARWHNRYVSLHHLVLRWKTGRWRRAGEEVLHSCDRPACINPDHLRWGTGSENALDCVTRGRHWQSERRYVV